MTITSLDTLMTPATDCLDGASLRALVGLRAEPQAQERVDWLARRAHEGLLTAEEQAEYESCSMFANFLGVLQTKARRKLKIPA